VDRRAKVELFEQIRRDYEHGGGTIRGIAKKLGIHRRMVREAVLSAVPMERKTPVRERPKLQPAIAFIDALLEADHKVPRKQRHTAHRIWCRIRAEMPEVEVAESTIRRHVRERKMKLGLTRRETFLEQLAALQEQTGRSAARCVPISTLRFTRKRLPSLYQVAGEDVGAGDRCSAAKCSDTVGLHGCIPGEFSSALEFQF
jgi:hypothetical protein